MRYKARDVMGFGTPPDGVTDTEKQLLQEIERESLLTLYKKLPTSRMRLVVALHFDLGWSQEMVSDLLGIKQPSLQDEINHIRRVLKGDPYKPHKHKTTVKVEDVMKYLHLIMQP